MTPLLLKILLATGCISLGVSFLLFAARFVDFNKYPESEDAP